MTSQSFRRFAGAGINAGDLFARYKIACDLKQTVDCDKIEAALRKFAVQIECAEVVIKFVRTADEVRKAAKDARAARDVWAAWDARAARDAWDVWAARDARAARDAWDVWAARVARDVWAARVVWAAWDVSYAASTAIGASALGEEKTLQAWLPIFEAFEAGAFALWIGKGVFYVAVIPHVVKIDDKRRLHCEDGPAFAWLDDIRDYYWRGVHVPSEWITNPASITPEAALAEANIEKRRAACALIPGGWETILTRLDAKTIDRDGDPQIGELVEVKLPGEDKDKITARYLRVVCGTGRKFAVCVPPDTETALDAQSWMLGLPTEKFIRPEVRT